MYGSFYGEATNPVTTDVIELDLELTYEAVQFCCSPSASFWEMSPRHSCGNRLVQMEHLRALFT
jgi:hypothetical protein